jgi:hypothetical protein
MGFSGGFEVPRENRSNIISAAVTVVAGTHY